MQQPGATPQEIRILKSRSAESAEWVPERQRFGVLREYSAPSALSSNEPRSPGPLAQAITFRTFGANPDPNNHDDPKR